MALTYCFESAYAPRTLAKCKKNDLAVVDTEGCELSVKEAVKRGVHVYGYLNVGAVENGRSYYEDFHHIRLAKYSGYTDSLNINTFAGAMEQMFKSAIARFPTAKIGYIFIHKCVDNFDSRVANSYYGIAKAACEKWGIPYCDLNTQTPPIGHISSLASAYTVNGGDGIHLNESGYRNFYVPKIVAWMKTL